MRARILVGLALVVLFSFAGAASAAEPWEQPSECKQMSKAPAPAIEDGDALKAAIFTTWWCTSNADCPCAPPACYCITSIGRCLCKQDLCCPDGECP